MVKKALLIEMGITEGDAQAIIETEKFGPYIRENNKLTKTSWDNVYKILINKFKNFQPSQMAGIVGDLADLEMVYSFKDFFEKSLSLCFLEIISAGDIQGF